MTGSCFRVTEIFTKMWCPSADFPEYSRVANVSRTEAWGDINTYEHIHFHTLNDM